jgi:hypothetical protein
MARHQKEELLMVISFIGGKMEENYLGYQIIYRPSNYGSTIKSFFTVY